MVGGTEYIAQLGGVQSSGDPKIPIGSGSKPVWAFAKHQANWVSDEIQRLKENLHP